MTSTTIGVVAALIGVALVLRGYATIRAIISLFGGLVGFLIGAAVVVWGTSVAQRLSWRALTFTVWATSFAWAFALAMVDGWQRGFAGRLTSKHEYLRQVPTITDIPEAVRTFSSRILDYQPNSWITHVSGHPPGALLTFVWLDRIGLGGGAWPHRS